MPPKLGECTTCKKRSPSRVNLALPYFYIHQICTIWLTVNMMFWSFFQRVHRIITRREVMRPSPVRHVQPILTPSVQAATTESSVSVILVSPGLMEVHAQVGRIRWSNIACIATKGTAELTDQSILHIGTTNFLCYIADVIYSFNID